MQDATTGTEAAANPWERLRELVAGGKAEPLEEFLDSLPPWEQARAVSRLDDEERSKLLTVLSPLRATELMEIVSTTQAVDMITGLDPVQAAVIMDGMRSDRQADLIGQMDSGEADAILDQMVPEQAEEARQLASYPKDTAGGIMGTEYLAFPRHLTVNDVISAMREYARANADYQVQYAYVTDGKGKLIGVLRLRDLIFSAAEAEVDSVMMRDPVKVLVTGTLDQIQQEFEQHSFMGLPVVDDQGRLLGVVSRENIEHASQARANQMLLRISGIIGGEEFRTMPLRTRAGRRLAWLSLNIFLNLFAAAVVAMYTETLEKVIVLAVFLPIISDMSGCSGNQAVAVSIRELTLGLVRPTEFARVLFKEAMVGIVNGLALGVFIAVIAYVWKQNAYLGVVVGLAMAANSVVSVVVGGLLPLALKRLRLDPALMASPLLTTVTDMCGFFIVLSVASQFIPQLTGTS